MNQKNYRKPEAKPNHANRENPDGKGSPLSRRKCHAVIMESDSITTGGLASVEASNETRMTDQTLEAMELAYEFLVEARKELNEAHADLMRLADLLETTQSLTNEVMRAVVGEIEELGQ